MSHISLTVNILQSWRIRQRALPALVVFFYHNLLTITQASIDQVMDILLSCLEDENIEVRELASKSLSGIIRCSQRRSIIPLKVWTLPLPVKRNLILVTWAEPLRHSREENNTPASP